MGIALIVFGLVGLGMTWAMCKIAARGDRKAGR